MSPVHAEPPTPPPPPPPPLPPPPPPPAPHVAAVQFTQFSRGAGQHGAPRAALAQPLLLEVRDETGKPIAGEAVTFTITSGSVTPRVAASDSAGVIPVRVTLGERAGQVVITANVGSFIRTATVYADPGAPHELVVERGDAPVVGGVSIRTRDTVVLRVVALDAYGNRTTLDNFSATTSGRAALRRGARFDRDHEARAPPQRRGHDRRFGLRAPRARRRGRSASCRTGEPVGNRRPGRMARREHPVAGRREPDGDVGPGG